MFGGELSGEADRGQHRRRHNRGKLGDSLDDKWHSDSAGCCGGVGCSLVLSLDHARGFACWMFSFTLERRCEP